MNLFEHNDNFEQFLREATENFKMRPSIKVWNSIYNNFHPSKKSPSAAAFLVFIISFFLLSNNSVVFQKTDKVENKLAVQIQINQNLPHRAKNEKTAVHKKTKSFYPRNENKSKEQINKSTSNHSSNPATIENNTLIDLSELKAQPLLQDFSLHQKVKLPVVETTNKENSLAEKPLLISVKNNEGRELSYQLYATSSIGYSSGYKNTESEIAATTIDNFQNVNDLNKALRYMPEFNFEAGGAFLVNVTSSLRLKAGMQLNYTNYKITNGELNNDIVITEKNNPIQADEIQTLNADLNSDFKNYNSSTYQISIPLGTELELIGNRQLKWFAGATIQPSYIVGGYPSQNTNQVNSYFQDGYGLRKWNVNTSFETFLSYKLPNGSRINAGPQFRYQLFSSYESKYLYNEKQYNIGLKLGISRNF